MVKFRVICTLSLPAIIIIVELNTFTCNFKVVNEAGRPKIKVEHKGETKAFFAEEVNQACSFDCFLRPFFDSCMQGVGIGIQNHQSC